MDLIYASFENGAFVELCYLNDCIVDGEVGKDTNNDTTLKIYDTTDLLKVGNHILHEEIGGVIDGYKIDTQEQSVTYHISNWFKMLEKVIIEPSEQNAYRYVDAASLVSIIDEELEGVIKLNENDLMCPVYEKVRYQSVLYVFDKLNENLNGMQPFSFKYENGCMNIKHHDLSTTDVTFNNDYGVKMLVDYQENYNHLIALGSGELANREVLHFFYDNGTVSTNDHKKARKTYVLDEANVESSEKLNQDAINKLKEVAITKTLEVEILEGDYNIGDIMHVKEATMGFDEKIMITQKIYTGNITNGISDIKIDYKVGG